jgi:hypothetical protein
MNLSLLKRFVAGLELLLVLPAILFMTALFVRNLQPAQYEPARTAARLVEWFAAQPLVGLGVLLIALPLAALFIGSASVVLDWRRDAELRQAALGMVAALRGHLAILSIAIATLTACVILAIVALHVLTD